MSDGRLFSGVLLVDPRGWVLLQERDEHPAIDPERWGLVGGHLDPDEVDGEQFEPAAYRELAEETEVVLPPGRLTYWREFAVDHTDAYGTVDRMAVFVADVDLTDDDVVCHEGRRIVLVDPTTVAGLPLTKGAEVILPEFFASEVYGRRRAGGSPAGG